MESPARRAARYVQGPHLIPATVFAFFLAVFFLATFFAAFFLAAFFLATVIPPSRGSRRVLIDDSITPERRRSRASM